MTYYEPERRPYGKKPVKRDYKQPRLPGWDFSWLWVLVFIVAVAAFVGLPFLIWSL